MVYLHNGIPFGSLLGVVGVPEQISMDDVPAAEYAGTPNYRLTTRVNRPGRAPTDSYSLTNSGFVLITRGKCAP